MTREELARWLAQQKTDVNSELDALNERELEIFSILSQGYSAAQMELEFGISRRELTAAKRSMQKKLKLKSEVQLLQFAAKHRTAT